MKKKKLRMMAVFAAAALAMLPACSPRISSRLKVGVKGDVANFALYDAESGHYSGMEIDLAQLISGDLGYGEPEFVSVTASTREKMLDSGDLDMVIATYSVTDERKERYDFSAAYYTDYVAVMVEESSMISKLADLKDCRIGVMKNTSNPLSMASYMAQKGVIQEFDEEGFSADSFDGGIHFVEYDSYNEASDALEYGDVDAFVADRSILSGYMGDGRVVLPDEFSEQEYGVCTKKGSSLSGKVDEAVRKRLEDGTIKELTDKWGN